MNSNISLSERSDSTKLHGDSLEFGLVKAERWVFFFLSEEPVYEVCI